MSDQRDHQDAHTRPTDGELTALRQLLQTRPVALYNPATGRIHRCPNPNRHPAPCNRADTFTIPEAQHLAAQLPGAVILVYGIPWTP